jgi:superfamily I DNA and/or RNA helicase
VQYEHAVRPDLAELLAVPATATPAEQVHEPTLRQDLDDDKRTALRTALSRPDLMIVKGPPGTGKTRFIVELVYQTLQRDPTCRVLIASQTHAALDNALARIRQLDGTLKLLRFARTDEERVAEAVADLRLDAQLEKWQAEVKRQGDAWLNRWATEAGVEPDAVWAAMTLEELAAEIEAIQRLQENIATVQKQRDSLHSRNTDPGSTSATADALRVLADENDELREKLRSAESRGRDLLAQLITRGELSRRTRLGQLVANDLRGRASALAPDTSEGRRCRELIDLLAQWHARFGTTSEFIAAALARAQIVGATCVGLGGIRGLNDIEFGLCIVDEASRATAPELMIPMSRSRRFVLVGDEQQLPPHFDHDLRDTKLLESLGLGVEDLDESFFSHLSDGLPRENVVELNLQHRMSPAIARLVSYCFYGQRLRSVQDEEPYDRNLCLVAPRPVTWFTTSRLAGRWETRRGDSIVNEVEIAEIKRLLGEIAGAAAKRSGSTEVVILAGYRAQCEALRGRLAVEMGDTGPLIASVHTVDAFQGQEADVVIYSVTRSNRQGKLGFIRERPRLNVALSRARELLLIVGDHASARRRGGDNPMRDVVEHVEAHPADCAMVEVSG